MFGYVTASWKELTAEEQKRYGAVYCGICREIRQRSTGIGRICLSYDMAFLALLLMSLYEPEEESGKKACRLHSVKPRPMGGQRIHPLRRGHERGAGLLQLSGRLAG